MAKTRQIDKRTREKILENIQNEIATARTAKRARVSSWHKNENLLYESERFKNEFSTRSQIALHKMNGYIQTILSKIDDPLTFKFLSNKISKKNQVDKYNAIKEIDYKRDRWEFKDLLGKRQGVFYGRTVYFYHATGDSKNDYKPHLELVDVYDFLIDPRAGGLDMENARYMGHYNVRYSKSELEKGIKDGIFIKEATKDILEGNNSDNITNDEEVNKDNRYAKYSNYNKQLDQTRVEDYRFWSWVTTFEGERYYALYSEAHGQIIRLEHLEKLQPNGKFPYWSWASFPDHAEFWSQSYADVARDIIMGQSASINQMMDNADKINNPQRLIDTSALVDENELRFKKRGFIRTNRNAQGVMEEFSTPSIDTPLGVYETLENILQLQSGVTGAVQGIAEEDKVGIYEGNQNATADRFNLLNKSYSDGYERFANLWKNGVDAHLKRPVAIKLIGPEGVEMTEFKREDILDDTDVDIIVESGNSESQISQENKRTKVAFLQKYQDAPFINQKAMFEIEAEIVQMKKDEVKRLLAQDDMAIDVQVEAHRDIEKLLTGAKIYPNDIADTSYMQIILDYMKNHREDLSGEVYNRFEEYLRVVQPIVVQNTMAKAQKQVAEEGLLQQSGGMPNINNQQPQGELPNAI